jgi:hypothetical protein
MKNTGSSGRDTRKSEGHMEKSAGSTERSEKDVDVEIGNLWKLTGVTGRSLEDTERFEEDQGRFRGDVEILWEVQRNPGR